MQAQLWDERL